MQPGRSWFSRVCFPQFFGLRQRSAQKIRRVKSTLAIVESDDYASPNSVHRNDAGCAWSFHNKDNGSNEPAVSVRCNTIAGVFTCKTNKAPVVGTDSLLLRVRSLARGSGLVSMTKTVANGVGLSVYRKTMPSANHSVGLFDLLNSQACQIRLFSRRSPVRLT